MSKIFIFGIGGTGSRVLRSLTMILATGVKFGADEIVPIIIDPDAANADLTRTVSLLNNYSEIRENLQFNTDNKNRFFRTEIERILPNYTLRINDTDDKSFQQFIEYASMSKSNKALTKMLFSDKNLESKVVSCILYQSNLLSIHVIYRKEHEHNVHNTYNCNNYQSYPTGYFHPIRYGILCIISIPIIRYVFGRG